MIQVGILGCGAIGQAIAKAIEKKFSKFMCVSSVCDCNPAQIKSIKNLLKFSKPAALSWDKLVAKSDLVIEAASIEAARQAIPAALKLGKSIIVLSTGAILKIRNFRTLIKKSQGSIYLPSGALSGVDAVLGAGIDGIQRARITTRKPIKSLKDSPFFMRHRDLLKKIRKPTLIFKGTALQAVKEFPENINVAATLSLAGIGPRKTRVHVYASPTYKENRHEISVVGQFGKIACQTTNFPSKRNPKTSRLAIGSAIATLSKVLSRVKIGT
jgi:aspartate dehydrogenase